MSGSVFSVKETNWENPNDSDGIIVFSWTADMMN